MDDLEGSAPGPVAPPERASAMCAGRACADQPRPGAVVVAADGPIGLLERLVTSARRATPSHLVVRWRGHPRLVAVVPWEQVVAVAEDRVRVSGTVADIAAMRGYTRSRDGWLRPLGEPLPLSTPGSDADLAAQLRERLDREPLTRHSHLKVEVRDGVACLEGMVDTVAAKYAARRLALTTPGIWHVTGRIDSDEEIMVAAHRLLREQPAFHGARLEVRSDLGEVTIRGTMPPAQQEQFVAAVRSLPGVRTLRVEWEQTSDLELDEAGDEPDQHAEACQQEAQ